MTKLYQNEELMSAIPESFLRHVEETIELLENSYSQSLMKRALKQIREAKKSTKKVPSVQNSRLN